MITILAAIWAFTNKLDWVNKTVMLTMYGTVVFLLQRTMDLVGYVFYSVARVIAMIAELEPQEADPIWNSAIEILSMANTFVPFDTLFASMSVYWAFRLATVLIRSVKAWIPTVA